MDSIKVRVDKTGLFVEAPQRFNQAFADKLNSKIIEGGLYLLAELQKNSPVGATGQFRAAWKMDTQYEQINGVRMVQVSITNPSVQTETLEYGRRAAPVSAEGQKSIVLWVVRKLRKPLAEAKSIAFLICRKKRLFPTKGQEFITKTLEYAFPQIGQRISEAFNGELNLAGE